MSRKIVRYCKKTINKLYTMTKLCVKIYICRQRWNFQGHALVWLLHNQTKTIKWNKLNNEARNDRNWVLLSRKHQI